MQQFDSVPLPRIIDVEAFGMAMLAACGDFEEGGGGTASALLLVRKALKVRCVDWQKKGMGWEESNPKVGSVFIIRKLC